MKFKIINILACTMLTLSSCNKWLDIQPKGRILLTTAADYGMLLDNIVYYDNTDIVYLDDERWPNTSSTASVWNVWNLAAANSLYLPNETYDRSLNANQNTSTLNSTSYEAFYQRISRVANTIINEKNKMTGTDAEIRAVVAEAKMLRAFNYFLLINMYAKPYDKATAANDGGVPLKLDPYIETAPEEAKSSVAAVYAQIEKDIEEAIPDLNVTAKTPYRFNKAAAYALKAKVHLFKKEFDACITAALQSYQVNHKTFDLATLVNPVTNKPGTALLATGEENLFFATASAPFGYIGQELIDLYKSGLQAYGQAANVTDARFDLYKRPAATVNDYMFIASWVPGTKEFSANVMGLATTEVMLMLAECYARKGENGQVKKYLEPYLKSRYRNYNHAAFTLPADITGTVKFVINERRKELVRGSNRFFDLRRLNTETAYQKVPTRLFPADPVATPSIPQQTYRLPVNSPLYILPFPSRVIENDKRLTSNTW